MQVHIRRLKDLCQKGPTASAGNCIVSAKRWKVLSQKAEASTLEDGRWWMSKTRTKTESSLKKESSQSSFEEKLPTLLKNSNDKEALPRKISWIPTYPFSFYTVLMNLFMWVFHMESHADSIQLSIPHSNWQLWINHHRYHSSRSFPFFWVYECLQADYISF